MTNVSRRVFAAAVAIGAVEVGRGVPRAKAHTLLAQAAPTAPPAAPARVRATLIKGARIFNGTAPALVEGMDVLIEGNMIRRIERGIDAPSGTTVIDAGGRTMMPGLIDAHWHSVLSSVSLARILQSDFGYLNIVAARANRDALLRGFTSVRDVGGNVFALQQATDEGIIEGPRIYPSGPTLSQTGGHGDFRGPNEVPTNPGAPLDYLQRIGMTLIADGVPEVIRRTREILRMGASQVKVMAGGGVSSLYDPVDVTQYTFDEMKAAVEVAATWNTYVTVHAFTDGSVQQAINAGVRCIEHGMLLEEPTIRLMAEKGVWFSSQPILDDEDAIPFSDPVNRAKFIEVTNGTDRAYRLAKAHNLKIAFGTDTLFDPELAKKQGKQLAKLTRWFSPFETLKMATHDNAQLLAMSGPRNPYPGKLGVIEADAYADLLLVNGDPVRDINLIADPEHNLALIMKDGRVHKSTLA